MLYHQTCGGNGGLIVVVLPELHRWAYIGNWWLDRVSVIRHLRQSGGNGCLVGVTLLELHCVGCIIELA